jgi:NADH:quinone reductase (non-electrogenic)
MEKRPHIIIIGGGFAGLYAAKTLKRAAVDITLIDKRNFHLFQPLLYQVATGGLSPGDIASPLRAVLKNQRNTRVIMGSVIDLDCKKRKVFLKDKTLDYDYLIVATGVRHAYFGNDQWEDIAQGLKTIEDAVEMRRRLFYAFEAAEQETNLEKQKQWLNFVLIGGGPTGVELAGALAELAKHTLKNNFRNINPAHANIHLVEGMDRILSVYPEKLSTKAHSSLEKLGVIIHTNTLVTDIDQNSATMRHKKQKINISTKTVFWAAGVQASLLGNILGEKAEAKLDRIGRIEVEPDLSITGYPEIFVVGDLANFKHQTGNPLPGVAPVAMQQGLYVAKRINQKLKGKKHKPFHYHNRGAMAVIGRAAAIADLKFFMFSGYPAWFIWLFIHIMYLVGYQNRILVFIQWAIYYFTRNRGARLITEQHLSVLKALKKKEENKNRGEEVIADRSNRCEESPDSTEQDAG